MSHTPKGRIEEIREREKKATKGPWFIECRHAITGRIDAITAHAGHIHPLEENCWNFDDCPGQDAEEIVTSDSGAYGPNIKDAEFIIHARTDIPYLLEINADLMAALEKYGYHFVETGVKICAWFDGKPCDCGFDAAIARARGQSQ